MTYSVLAACYKGKMGRTLTHYLCIESGKTPCGIDGEHLCQDGTETEVPTCPKCRKAGRP